jgi:hypothetical protein
MVSSKNGSNEKPAPRWRFWLPRIVFAIGKHEQDDHVDYSMGAIRSVHLERHEL